MTAHCYFVDLDDECERRCVALRTNFSILELFGKRKRRGRPAAAQSGDLTLICSHPALLQHCDFGRTTFQYKIS